MPARSVPMTTTLEQIHRDPAILDRAIAHGESLDIVAGGRVTATLVPKGRTPEPDFVARAKRIWGEAPQGQALSELLADSRDQAADALRRYRLPAEAPEGTTVRAKARDCFARLRALK